MASTQRLIDGFFILNRTGSLRFARDYTRDELDRSLVTGFFSSVNSFVSSLSSSESLRSLTLDRTRFLVRSLGDHLLVAHGPNSALSQVVNRLVNEAADLLVMFFGSHSSWAETMDETEGFEDVLDALFNNSGGYNSGNGGGGGAAQEEPMNSGNASGNQASGQGGVVEEDAVKRNSAMSRIPRLLVGGVERVLMEGTTRDQLDRAMATLEDHDDIRSSILFLGDFVLHSRLPAMETRNAQFFLSVRPMGVATSRRTPVYISGQWMHLLTVRLRNYTLAVLTVLDTPQNSISKTVRDFDDSLHESGLRLPLEPPPVLLRHFAPREVVAFVYHNARTGTTIAPRPRPFNEDEEREILDVLWWLFARACFLLSDDKSPSVLLEHDGLWFHAVTEDGSAIYVLYSGQVPLEVIEEKTRDLLFTVTRFAT